MAVEKIREFIKTEKQNIIDFLCEMVEVKSITCGEGEIISLVKKKMEMLGYDEVIIDSFGNVIGRIGTGDRILVYDAHLDVVDAEGQDWLTPPFKAVQKEGRIYGRGTVDDKGPFVGTLFAGKAVKDLGLADKYTVYVVGSIAEEDCEGLALGAFLEEKDIKPDHVVIAESSAMEICRGHRGRAQITATFRGESVHASRHEEGINPIELALPFLEGLKALDRNFPDISPLGKADITAVDVRCQSNSLSSVPAEARVFMDRRTNTQDTRESIIRELKTLPNVDKCELNYMVWESEGYNGRLLKGEEFFPAWALDESHPLIQAGVQAFKSYSGRDPVVTTWGFSTNGNYTMGKMGYPTIGFGPGDMSLCHVADECIEIDHLLEAVGFYAQLAYTLNQE
ncbi:MAG: YgeY family selenium metabolism-linked hydrolase [Spirochaetales bacterium]|nr:YgeY family selenium metabolism-linked hydrolase [Spirochaetales bacterium]